MGYCASTAIANVNFTGDAEDKAYKAALASESVRKLLQSPPESLSNLEEVCQEIGFDDWYWQEQKYRDEWFLPLLEAIAPYVDEDSFIEFSGEESDLWRFVFKNGKVYEISPTITWPEVE
jgi:hypothetical protein